jgi:hypothetical protein
MGKVINLGQETGNGTLQSPTQALNDALESIGKNGAFEKGKKILILALDDTDENYSISFIQAGMRMSDCNNLCDIAKALFKEEMGY